MALITRFTRLFTADMHAVLDRMEEPEALLRQSLREMEDAVNDLTRQLKLREEDLTKNRERQRQTEQSIARLSEELDLSFEAANDELIRRCLRRRLEQQRQLDQLKSLQTQLEAEVAQLAPRLNAQGDQLEALRQKAALFDVAPECGPVEGARDPYAVTEADVDLALLRELQQRRAS
ncbi:MAG: PspA/IM30 family protein [Xanthomonadales bacterium]|nr:PspA/IM30 family protein [Xanthomonadales bacterium]